MPRWEYLQIRFVVSGGFSSKFHVGINMANKVSLQWISQQYPQVKIEQKGIATILDLGNHVEIHDALLDYLGSEGWEAYAVAQSWRDNLSSTIHYLKRSK